MIIMQAWNVIHFVQFGCREIKKRKSTEEIYFALSGYRPIIWRKFQSNGFIANEILFHAIFICTVEFGLFLLLLLSSRISFSNESAIHRSRHLYEQNYIVNSLGVCKNATVHGFVCVCVSVSVLSRFLFHAQKNIWTPIRISLISIQ